MLDLAISLDTDRKGVTIIETNCGKKLKAPNWPQDSECNLVSFSDRRKAAEVVRTETLVSDIAAAIAALTAADALHGNKPDWYQRLSKHATGAHQSATSGKAGGLKQ